MQDRTEFELHEAARNEVNNSGHRDSRGLTSDFLRGRGLSVGFVWVVPFGRFLTIYFRRFFFGGILLTVLGCFFVLCYLAFAGVC
jgi:hypothetical protein